MFWGEGLQDTAYTPGMHSVLELFWNDTQVGYCSLEIDSCALYYWTNSALGMNYAWSSKLEKRDLWTATLDFLQTNIRPPVVTHVRPIRPAPDGASGVWGTPEGKQYKIPTIQDAAIQRKDPENAFSFCSVDLVLPRLDVPDVIKNRTVPDDLAQIKAALMELRSSYYKECKSPVEFVIPFYAPSDSELDILVKIRGKPDAVVLLVHGGIEANWQLGGTFDTDVSRFQVDRLAPIIRSAKMTSIVVN